MKSGSRNTMVTSDFRPEVEIWPFRACAMKNTQSLYLWPNRCGKMNFKEIIFCRPPPMSSLQNFLDLWPNTPALVVTVYSFKIIFLLHMLGTMQVCVCVRVWQSVCLFDSGVSHCVQILRQGHRRLATRSSVSLEHQRPFVHVYHAEFHHCPLVYRFTTLYPSTRRYLLTNVSQSSAVFSNDITELSEACCALVLHFYQFKSCQVRPTNYQLLQL